MKNKKKILVISPSIGFGGAEKNLINISNFLSKRFDISFLILQKRKNNINKNIFFKNINIYQFNFGRTFYAFLKIFSLIKKNDYKYVFISSIQLNFYLVLMKFFLKKNFLLIHRESNYPFINFKSLLNFFFRLFYIGSDMIIVQNKVIKDKIVNNFFLNKKKIFIVNNLIDLIYIKKLSLLKNNIKKKRNNNEIIFLNVGSVNEQKNQIEILNAFLYLSKYKINYKILFIGEGDNLKNLKNFVKDNKLRNVFFLGNKSNPYAYIKNSDIFLLSSKWEGSPNVLLESHYLNTPIISSDCKTGPTELKNLGLNIVLYKNGNSQDLAKKIKYMIKRKNNYKKNDKILVNINKDTQHKLNTIFK